MIPKVLEVRTFNEKKELIDVLCCSPAAAQDLNSILTLAPIGSTLEVSIKSLEDVNSNMSQS